MDVAGDASAVAVDANGAFSSEAGHGRVEELSAIGLRWIEEPVGPLDFHALAMVASETKCAFATGENLFSTADVINLLRYGGLRPERDVLQMDIALSYGVTEFIRMLDAAQGFGWRPESFMPHAGHQFALHVSAGLGLGAHEVASAAGGRLAAYPLILKSLMGWPGSATAQARESSTSRRYCSVSGGYCEVRAYPHPSLLTPLAHPPGMTTRWKRSMSARP